VKSLPGCLRLNPFEEHCIKDSAGGNIESMTVPRLKYFVQCDEVRNEGGKFSAIGIFDSIFALLFPATHKQFFVLMGFTGAAGEYEIELLVTSPEDRRIAKTTGELRVDSAETVTNLVFGFQNFPLPVQGKFTISVFLDGDYLCEHYFYVRPPIPPHERTREEIAMLLAKPDIVKSANADVACERCKTVYRFQDHLDPEHPIDQGFLKLPPGDVFACAVCGQHLSIKQVRENLRNLIGIPRQWLGGPPPGVKEQPRNPPERGDKPQGN
jgi:hypothetical protein